MYNSVEERTGSMNCVHFFGHWIFAFFDFCDACQFLHEFPMDFNRFDFDVVLMVFCFGRSLLDFARLSVLAMCFVSQRKILSF